MYAITSNNQVESTEIKYSFFVFYFLIFQFFGACAGTLSGDEAGLKLTERSA